MVRLKDFESGVRIFLNWSHTHTTINQKHDVYIWSKKITYEIELDEFVAGK